MASGTSRASPVNWLTPSDDRRIVSVFYPSSVRTVRQLIIVGSRACGVRKSAHGTTHFPPKETQVMVMGCGFFLPKPPPKESPLLVFLWALITRTRVVGNIFGHLPKACRRHCGFRRLNFFQKKKVRSTVGENRGWGSTLRPEPREERVGQSSRAEKQKRDGEV